MYNMFYIIGPTASGKSDLAMTLAERHNGVIINADSMQVYSGLQTITAAPDTAEKNRVPHMLYGYISPHTPFNVTTWRKHALEAVYTVLSQGKTPILCGGTGLYASAFIHGLSPIPDVDNDIRQAVRSMDVGAVWHALQSEDPRMARTLHAHDTNRIARALEVVRTTGQSLADFQNLPPIPIPDDIVPKLVAVLPSRDWVYNRINARYAHMFDNGAVGEVEALLNLDLPVDSQIMRAIGVPEIVHYIRGTYNHETAIAQGQMATRRYAKRQYTYIRHQLSPYVVYNVVYNGGDAESSMLPHSLRTL